MGLTFFGLKLETISEVRKNLFTEIHEIVFHGNGGYDWGTIYSLSIPLRRFIYTKIVDHYQTKNKTSKQKDSKTTTLVNPDGTINKSKATQLKVPKYK